MIHLTRLNGNPLVVNSDLIKFVEASPDTVLTLVNGEKIVVLESSDLVVARTVAWRARLLAAAPQTTSAWPPPPEAAGSPETKSAPQFSADALED
ncbi:MAG TPA: flagellar FlbD family protein [Acidobacteriaceae bacterium]